MPERPTAVLDANVLFPFQLRNLLLWLAVEALYDPLWSDEIVEECTRNLRREGLMTDAQCEHLLAQMRAHFPDAWGYGYEGRADHVVLPDPGDRHVVALALDYEAELIVTRNARHFPAKALRPLGVEPVSPDRFVGLLWEQEPDAVIRAAEQHRTSLRQPLDPADYLDSLRAYAELPESADRLAQAGFVTRIRPLDQSAGTTDG
jgi:predicted nucleic acid-binding protein